MGFFCDFLSGVGDTLGNAVLILFTVIFLLADASSFPRKLSMTAGTDAEKSLTALQDLASSMNGYIATKALVSLLTGFAIWLGLVLLLEADPTLSGMIIALYFGVNTLVGSVIEPAVIGQRVGLSTLAVFLSLVFWGWMFGAVGMLLSVPLTMVLKFISQQRSGTVWLALLVSNIPGDVAEHEKEYDTQNAPD